MTGQTSESRTAVVEREGPYPAEKIWRALPQPHLMAEWLLRNDFAPVIGHRFTFNTAWGGVMNCQVHRRSSRTARSATPGTSTMTAARHALKASSPSRLTPAAKGTSWPGRTDRLPPRPETSLCGARAGWRSSWKNSRAWWGGRISSAGSRAGAPGRHRADHRNRLGRYATRPLQRPGLACCLVASWR